MEITVSGRHLEITESMKQYAEQKAAKLPRYYDRIRTIEIVSDKHDSFNYQVEVIVKVHQHDPFIASSCGDDLYACIDDVVDKLERQLTDHKEKLRNRKHNT